MIEASKEAIKVNCAIAEALLDGGADINADVATRGETPLCVPTVQLMRELCACTRFLSAWKTRANCTYCIEVVRSCVDPPGSVLGQRRRAMEQQ